MQPRKLAWVSRCLPIPTFCLLLWVLYPTPRHALKPAHTNTTSTATQIDLQLQGSLIPPYSLTAILPLTHKSISTLEETLAPFLKPSTHLREIIIVCSQPIIAQARTVLRNAFSVECEQCPDLLLHTIPDRLDEHSGVVNAASQVSTEYVLLMAEDGLLHEDEDTRNTLLHPPATSVPIGPNGTNSASANGSCIVTSGSPKYVQYLYPPFVMPTLLAGKKGPRRSGIAVWADLSEHIAGNHPDGIGGIVLSTRTSPIKSPWCSTSGPEIDNSAQYPFVQDPPFFNEIQSDTCSSSEETATSRDVGVFALLLPTLEDFRAILPVVCSLQRQGHRIETFIYEESSGLSDAAGWETRSFTSKLCTAPYTIVFGNRKQRSPTGHILALEWLQGFGPQPDIVIYPREDDKLTLNLDVEISRADGPLQTIVPVRIFREDLPYSIWMGSLSLTEWRNWNVPRIDITIITKDRPHSLARLLTSLSNGRFFGDSVDLRVHAEQSSDLATMKTVENLTWKHGSLFVHHRIVHGGLLPAVVESWYPRSNDTYGLLLEDDVELSPLFYAWAKMTLLRYRYGDPRNRSPLMFGISLYQQKNIELPPEGRRPFDARKLFINSNVSDPITPYLSPIPCSWGAVYFPEHWREFHIYLALRLSEHSMKINQVVVPGVRSNRWTKSWKKYFIELVYLRGYVMLYPNYPDFISLSTNHLEVGSHVKVRTKEKEELFLVPLMELSSSRNVVGLLDLPGSTLPPWDALPVLNLTGCLTTLETLASQGRSRRTDLTGCTSEPQPHDVQDLMCIKQTSSP
ncbi:hypothetical protein Hypma_011994 [Hypsizygus marmoreus]|uniref:Uncharacterized protein n=1 Tax=Hypsizygus marmoreus TaxID=39966 RepID=A0A369JF92_HYPMA|nr:hypothetical protein Hypma_011994 [Hypsizygus marmoreus]